MEDLLNENIYRDYLLKNGIDITNNKFKNQSRKWSNKIADIAVQAGIDFTDTLENKFKEELQKLVTEFKPEFFTQEGYLLLCRIRDKIKNDLISMGILK